MHRLSLSIVLFTFISCVQNTNIKPEFIPCDTLTGWENESGERCGYLTVPENHYKPDGRKIKIAFAIKKGSNDASGIPTIYLTGGPGEPALSIKQRFYRDDLLSIGDVILLDQRGMGLSTPLERLDQIIIGILAQDLTMEQERLEVIRTMRDMKKQLISEGIDLSMYNTIQNARDVGALMNALGYKQYNLWGGSYGTKLGAYVMKYFPEKIHAAALTAPATLNNTALVSRIPDFTNALEALINKCPNDPDCANKHPDLRSDILMVLNELESDPVTISLVDRPFTINPQDAVFLIRYLLYRSNGDQLVSQFIIALKEKNIEALQNLSSNAYAVIQQINLTAFYSFEAYEEFGPSTIDDLNQAISKSEIVSIAGLAWFQSFIPALGEWHSGRVTNEENELKNIQVPTVVIANAFDPSTPSKYALMFDQAIDPCYIINLKKFGHGAFGPCMAKIRREFLQDPNKPIDEECD